MLLRIRVKNFKSLKDLDYKCAKLNLLTGLNGAGKSSFIQFLLLLRSLSSTMMRSSAKIQLQEIGVAGSFVDIKYCYAGVKEKVVFRVDFDREIINEETDEKSRIEASICRIIDGDPSDKRLLHISHPELENIYNKAYADVVDFTSHFDDFAEIEQSEELQARFHKINKRCDAIAHAGVSRIEKADAAYQKAYESLWRNARFVGAFRQKPHVVHNGGHFDTIKSYYGSKIKFEPEGDDVAEYLYKCKQDPFCGLRLDNPMLFSPNDVRTLRYQYSSSGGVKGLGVVEASPLIDQVNRWLSVVSPGAKLSIDRKEIGDDEKYVVAVGYGDEGGAHNFKPQNVGFGISYVLPVLVTLLSSQPGDIVILENPEAHLHPKGQSEMGRLISCAVAYGVQVFVETHSDHVINGIRVAVVDKLVQPEDVNIAFFERKEHAVAHDDGSAGTETYAEVCNIKLDKRGFLSEYPEGFMDEWNNQLLELS